jgi:hypothetical protein
MKNTIKDMVTEAVLINFRNCNGSLKLISDVIVSDVWNTVAGSIMDFYEMYLSNCVRDEIAQKLK